MIDLRCLLTSGTLLKTAAKSKLKLRDRVELLILNGKGQVLIGTNPRHNTAQLPGGGVDGSSVNSAAKKEALEEAGVKVTGVKAFGMRPVNQEVQNYKKGFDGHRTFWRTAKYVGDSDELLGKDGDAMKGLKFMPIEEAIARLKQPKADGTHDMLAGSREAALLRLQARMSGAKLK